MGQKTTMALPMRRTDKKQKAPKLGAFFHRHCVSSVSCIPAVTSTLMQSPRCNHKTKVLGFLRRQLLAFARVKAIPGLKPLATITRQLFMRTEV